MAQPLGDLNGAQGSAASDDNTLLSRSCFCWTLPPWGPDKPPVVFKYRGFHFPVCGGEGRRNTEFCQLSVDPSSSTSLFS